jgi:hypothetical protein
MPLLGPGDPFPRLPITAAGGARFTIPDAFADDFGVVLFFRAHGVPTATRSCAPSRGREADWPAKAYASLPYQSMTSRPPPR